MAVLRWQRHERCRLLLLLFLHYVYCNGINWMSEMCDRCSCYSLSTIVLKYFTRSRYLRVTWHAALLQKLKDCSSSAATCSQVMPSVWSLPLATGPHPSCSSLTAVTWSMSTIASSTVPARPGKIHACLYVRNILCSISWNSCLAYFETLETLYVTFCCILFYLPPEKQYILVCEVNCFIANIFLLLCLVLVSDPCSFIS